MGERRLQVDEVQQLRQRQRDHREVDALPADGDEAGDDGKRGGAGDADQNSEFRRHAPDLERMRRAIARGPQKHRVAERQQAAIADQQVERAGEQREAQRLHHEERVDAGQRHQPQQHRHRREHDHLVAHRARRYRQCVVSQCAHVRPPVRSVPLASPATPAPSGRTPRCWKPRDKNTWSVPRSRRAQSR